jgi:hypothetical protein
VAKPNFQFEKRQKELEKKRRNEEKLRRKQEKKAAGVAGDGEPDDAAEQGAMIVPASNEATPSGQ